jgi:hypothetical protein
MPLHLNCWPPDLLNIVILIDFIMKKIYHLTFPLLPAVIMGIVACLTMSGASSSKYGYASIPYSHIEVWEPFYQSVADINNSNYPQAVKNDALALLQGVQSHWNSIKYNWFFPHSSSGTLGYASVSATYTCPPQSSSTEVTTFSYTIQWPIKLPQSIHVAGAPDAIYTGSPYTLSITGSDNDGWQCGAQLRVYERRESTSGAVLPGWDWTEVKNTAYSAPAFGCQENRPAATQPGVIKLHTITWNVDTSGSLPPSDQCLVETVITVPNRAPVVSAIEILDVGQTQIVPDAQGTVELARDTNFYIRVSGTDPDGRLANLHARVIKPGNITQEMQSAASGTTAMHVFGPFNTGAQTGNCTVKGLVNDQDRLSGTDETGAGWASLVINVNIVPGDTEAPSVPASLAASSISQTSFWLGWAASTDNVAVTGYEVQCNGQAIGSPAQPPWLVTGRQPGTLHALKVRAHDAAGNWSAWSTALNVTTLPDTSNPDDDSDGDGVPNGVEEDLGTNPAVPGGNPDNALGIKHLTPVED